MVARSQSTVVRHSEPTPIDAGAVEHLRYIRSAIEASQTFTTVPGKGCIVMGGTALVAAALESVPALAVYWLPIWFAAAVAAGVLALSFMETKARAQGLSLRRAVAWRFFLTLAPAFSAGAILTVALYGEVGREVISGIWLLLYGTGVAACGVFSIPVVLVAGFAFMACGTLALMLPAGSAPIMLALGFGGIHIVLGVIIARNHGG
ncbi:MAG TPA: hypothetical protein VE175_13575 [Woeseiaceae bacterium]|jgi:hypothetical protein|nr:hypothetical protein [Woeseiaceae bacterium]